MVRIIKVLHYQYCYLDYGPWHNSTIWWCWVEIKIVIIVILLPHNLTKRDLELEDQNTCTVRSRVHYIPYIYYELLVRWLHAYVYKKVYIITIFHKNTHVLRTCKHAHITCHTGSVCFPVFAVEWYMALGLFSCRLYTLTEPLKKDREIIIKQTIHGKIAAMVSHD